MTEITTRVETIDHGDSVERILHITITAKTADEMRTIYRFTKYQNEGLDALLDELGVITGLLGDLNIRQEDAVELLKNLPANLSPERRAVIEHALTLVGKVNYFWGGKSLVLGWDSRWGTTMQVTAAGSSSSGTYRPYGLDCSGFCGLGVLQCYRRQLHHRSWRWCGKSAQLLQNDLMESGPARRLGVLSRRYPCRHCRW